MRAGPMSLSGGADTAPSGAPGVVIVGAGFAGLEVAKALADSPTCVTIIDRHNHTLFQPLLYQVAAMATIGRSAAVADLRGFRVTGTLAWLLWGVVHLHFLIGFRNHVLVLTNWMWAWLTYGSGARLIIGDSRFAAAPPRPSAAAVSPAALATAHRNVVIRRRRASMTPPSEPKELEPAPPLRPISRCLVGQKALVTGANSGIGRAVALALGQAGADVVVNYVVNEDAAEAVVEEILKAGVKAYAQPADVSREDQVQTMFQRMIREFGTIDILVNNAGLQRDAPFADMSLGDWNTVLGVNLTGQFLCAREAVREFLRRGVVPAISQAAGKIICMSSVHQEIPWGGHANYAASKGGVMMMMQSLAQEMAPHRIRINSIAPGAIRTPINRPAWQTKEAYDALMTLIPYRRIGEPIDIARAAIWLASDDSDYVVGATLFIDGGMTLFPGFATGG